MENRRTKQGKTDSEKQRSFVPDDQVGGKHKLRQRLCMSQEAGKSSQQKEKVCFGKAEVGGVEGSSTLKDRKERT